VLRYYVLATVLVLGVLLIGGLLVHRRSVAIRIASVDVSVPPKAIDETQLSGSPPPLSGEAPWALSVLPECFRQLSEISGPRAFVLAHLPQGVPVSGAVVHAHDCTLRIGSGAAVVTRGADRLVLTKSAFSWVGADLGVYHADGPFAEFRRYRVK
jgi:hypothetical protein